MGGPRPHSADPPYVTGPLVCITIYARTPLVGQIGLVTEFGPFGKPHNCPSNVLIITQPDLANLKRGHK